MRRRLSITRIYRPSMAAWPTARVMAMAARTGCNTVHGSTPPNNPHPSPWMLGTSWQKQSPRHFRPFHSPAIFLPRCTSLDRHRNPEEWHRNHNHNGLLPALPVRWPSAGLPRSSSSSHESKKSQHVPAALVPQRWFWNLAQSQPVHWFTVPNGVPKLPNEVTLGDFWCVRATVGS